MIIIYDNRTGKRIFEDDNMSLCEWLGKNIDTIKSAPQYVKDMVSVIDNHNANEINLTKASKDVPYVGMWELLVLID